MKTKNLIIALSVVLFQVIMFTSCEKEEPVTKNGSSILPAKFSVDIPTSLSNDGMRFKSAAIQDTAAGNEIYKNLTTFIGVGKGASKIAEDIILAIAVYHINQPMVLSYTGDDDKRVKNLKVIENATYEGKTWQFSLLITDAESESNPDGGRALEVFWNLKPIDGIAIIKPYNCNRIKDANSGDATFRIDYSEKQDLGYDACMTVRISGIPVSNSIKDLYAINNLKMFVGKKGDIIDVYGNSNHPNAKFFSNTTAGFNWAFVASGFDSKNIGVAEVGLPPSTIDETKRDVLLGYYSVKNVITREVKYVYPGINDDSLSAYLSNCDDPGYFSNRNFVSAGIAPSADYNEIEARLKDMVPFNPKEVSSLVISF